jgi:hypothetical protein
MGFTAPLYFLFSAFLLIVIMMYFFRKQYEVKSVPSVLLWQEWMNEFEAQAWWKKLQHHLLLYLQLLALLFLIFTLTQPFFQKEGVEGDHIIFIMDTSASMTAFDGDKTRLELAKEKVYEILDKVDNQSITILLASETPLILKERSKSTREIKQLIEALETSYAAANMLDSIHLAKSLLGEEHGHIQVLTDNLSEETDISVHNNTAFVAHNIGSKHENLAIGTFGVTSRDEKIVGVVTVKNEGKESKKVDLKIFGLENNVLHEQTETLKADQVKTIYLKDLAHSEKYRAEITGDSQYTLDNEQYTFLLQQQDPAVFVHKEIHPFARKAVEIASTNVIHLSSGSESFSSMDGIHLINGLPKEDWPDGPKLVFLSGDEGNQQQAELIGDITYDRAHPLLQSVELENVYIESAFQTEDFPDLQVVAQRGDTPLILSGMYEGYPVIVVAFELGKSDWPLHAGFPLFMFHSIHHLSQSQDLMGYFYPGESMDYFPSSDIKKIEIVNENEKTIMSLENFEQPITLPQKPGLYTFREYKGDVTVNRNLYVMLEDEEKTIVPAESFTISAAASPADKAASTTNKYLSFLFLALALVVLLVEWEVYRRAISS